MYASTSTTTTSADVGTSTSAGTSSSSSSHYHLLDCFPAPPTQTQHISFPMSDLRHHSQPLLLPSTSTTPRSPRSPLLLLPPQPHQLDSNPTTSFPSDVSSPAPSGALGLHTTTDALPLLLPYCPPAVISLGDEWTDDDASVHPRESSSSSLDASRLDVFGDSESYFAFSPESTSSSSSLSPELATEQLPLWQAEHPRLVSIRDAVLSSERAARYREACLESEVARIKDDLARVQEARARSRWLAASRAESPFRRNSTPDPSHAHPRPPAPLVRRASDSDVAILQRCAPEQPHPSSTSCLSDPYYDDVRLAIDELAVPHESPSQFWEEHYPDPETMLANHLTEARSARAEERRRRKRDHERIRELGILLSLGSEVRQWEERLAWENAFRPTDAMELDQVEDDAASSRRRSKSLPITPPSSSSSSSSSPLTPPLPPLSASPLWRVSAEMILRRRSLSERPRRTALVNANPPPPTPASVEAPVEASTPTDSRDSSSAKRHAVPPPIAIPSATSSGAASSLRSAPSRPSALKLCFTLEDLVAPEAAVVEKIEEDVREDEEMCNSSEESSEASDSDDSRCKSSSSNSSSSENENAGEKPLALRRGRSRWSWRKSLQSAQQLQQIAVDMEVDDA